MGAVEKDVLLILCIMSITQVTSWRGIVSPGHSFNLYSVGMKSEASHTANYVVRKIKKHVSRKKKRKDYADKVTPVCVN